MIIRQQDNREEGGKRERNGEWGMENGEGQHKNNRKGPRTKKEKIYEQLTGIQWIKASRTNVIANYSL